jgi:hypothetical protein
MYRQKEHLITPPQTEDVINFITVGNPTASTPVPPLQYGQVISPDDLTKLNIISSDPASVINPILSDRSANINDPDKNGDYNCLLYDNTLGLINDYNKDPLICSNNIQSKCTLSAFSDVNVFGVNELNKKTYSEYNTFIGPTGLQLEKQFVSCGDKVNKLMWIYKDANSASASPDAIGIPVEQCGILNLNNSDLTSSTGAINALCNIPETYALVLDTITNAGYKCKQVPPTSGTLNAAVTGTSSSMIDDAIRFKCNNL